MPQLPDVKILVVDDEADMRELVRMTLGLQGAIVQTTASATEALQTIIEFKPDVVISDIAMPDVDGYQFVQQLRRLCTNQPLPTIALTTYASELDQQHATLAVSAEQREAGFDRHLSKPIKPEELVETVAALIASAKQRSR